MSLSPVPEDTHLDILTRQTLHLMEALNTFTHMSLVQLLSLDTNGRRRLYDVLCALEGIGLLSKDRKVYTCKRQRYQLPVFSKPGMKKHIGTVYRHVRNHPGMFTLLDLVKTFDIPPRRMCNIFRVLKIFGVVIKSKVGCYTSVPHSVCSDSQWKRTLERIWGDSPEVQVLENNVPEGMCIDANAIGSDTQIIQIDSSEYQLLYVDNDAVISESYILETNSILEPECLPVEWNGTQKDCTNGEVQCIDITNEFHGHKGMLRDSHTSQVLCIDTEDLTTDTFDTQDILMNIPGGRVDWTNTDSLLESLLWLDED